MNPDGTVSSAVQSSDEQLDPLKGLMSEKELAVYGVNDDR
jgi:hypothetical protein